MSIPDHLHRKDKARLTRTVAELTELLGEHLLAVALYGQAMTASYRPRRGRLQLAIVLDELTPELLRLLRDRMRAFACRHIATPLVIDPLYLKSSLDVFPLEFLELSDEHALVHGDSDPFARLPIDREHLRIEIEEQVRGKMLHLWEAYLESRGRAWVLRRILGQTPAGFLPALRAMLYLADRTRPDSGPRLITETEAAFECQLPTLARLLGGPRLGRAELEPAFEGYLAEVRSLVRIADGLGQARAT